VEEGPAPAEEALCSKLAKWKPEKFSIARLNKAGGQTASAHQCVGLCLHFLYSGFLRASTSELAQADPRFCCVVNETIINE